VIPRLRRAARCEPDGYEHRSAEAFQAVLDECAEGGQPVSLCIELAAHLGSHGVRATNAALRSLEARIVALEGRQP
jgi:hypothetical protein